MINLICRPVYIQWTETCPYKRDQCAPIHAANLVANSWTIAYGVASVVLKTTNCTVWCHYNMANTVKPLMYTKSHNLNVSRLVLQLSLPNPLKPGVTRTCWRRIKTLSQHQVRVNLQSHAQHQLWISTWHFFTWNPQNNTRLKLSCKFSESKCNPLLTYHIDDFTWHELCL